MVIHYRSKKDKRYPKTLCGNASLSSDISEDINKCTCKICLKVYNGFSEKERINKSLSKPFTKELIY